MINNESFENLVYIEFKKMMSRIHTESRFIENEINWQVNIILKHCN